MNSRTGENLSKMLTQTARRAGYKRCFPTEISRNFSLCISEQWGWKRVWLHPHFQI